MQHDKPLVILAPMDGITDPPFRRFVKRVAPGIVVFSEFLSARLVAQKPALAKTMFRMYADEQPVVIQLYGKDAEDFRIAARLAEAEGAAGIDINMGCPAKKVVAHRHGSALMREIDLACDIIASVKAAVSVPVTVKTRLGWEDCSKLIPFVQRLAAVGLDGITIHGRTYMQKFEGEADFEPIYALKEAVDIPVFGNGDIDGADKARLRLGNLNGLMVGRAAVADPWVMCDILRALHGEAAPERPLSFVDKRPYWKAFAGMAVADRDELNACRSFRKYLVRLVQDLGLGPEVRKRAISVESLGDICDVLDVFAQEAADDRLPERAEACPGPKVG